MPFKKSKNNSKTLTALESVIVDAYDSGSLDEEVYNSLVKLGVKDSRGPVQVPPWSDGLALGTILQEEPIVVEVPPPSQLEEPEIIKYTEYAELQPVDDCEPLGVKCEDPVRTDSEIPITEGSVQQLGPSRTCLDEPGAQSDVLISVNKDVDGQVERNKDGSYLFTWCVECLRVDWFWSGDTNLPRKVGFGSDADHGTVLHCCGMHRQSRRARNKNNFGYGWSETERGPAQEPFKINAMAWKGTEIIGVARAITGKEVTMLADGQGCTAYLDVEDVLGILGPNDQAGSINLERFRAGGRKHVDLVLPFLAGGLLTRKVDN